MWFFPEWARPDRSAGSAVVLGPGFSSPAMLAIRDADAIEEAGEAVIEVVLPPPGQLAKAWENNALIRQQMRDGRKLLSWPSRVTIGAASQQALVLNRTVIMILVEQWGAVCAEPKSVPIKWMRDEVGGLSDKSSLRSCHLHESCPCR